MSSVNTDGEAKYWKKLIEDTEKLRMRSFEPRYKKATERRKERMMIVCDASNDWWQKNRSIHGVDDLDADEENPPQHRKTSQ